MSAMKSAHFAPADNETITAEHLTPQSDLVCKRDRVAWKCSLCSKARKVLVRVSRKGGGAYHYAFCSVCIRAMHKKLP